MSENLYEDIDGIVYISTNIGTGCKRCNGVSIGLDDFEGSVNHYIDKHNFRLLHVGMETSYDQDGKPWHSTVAVMGSA